FMTSCCARSLMPVFLIRRSTTSPLSPYTPLFRAEPCGIDGVSDNVRTLEETRHYVARWLTDRSITVSVPASVRADDSLNVDFSRSEEHTSELQSRENLVCRLLLEKTNTAVSANYP